MPEVACICCLSHIRSVPWLEQCFARANRLAPGKKRAVCFAPADWAFKKAVGMIKREELVPLSDGQQELFGGEEKRGEGNGSGNARPWIIPLSSSAEGANKRLSELLNAMDNLHFRVLKVETDGFAFELSIRSVRYEDEA